MNLSDIRGRNIEKIYSFADISRAYLTNDTNSKHGFFVIFHSRESQLSKKLIQVSWSFSTWNIVYKNHFVSIQSLFSFIGKFGMHAIWSWIPPCSTANKLINNAHQLKLADQSN